MSPAPSRRLLFALVASLGVHGLVWLLMQGKEREVRRAPAPVPAPVEWVEVEVAPPPPPPPEPPALEPSRAVKRPPPTPAKPAAPPEADVPRAEPRPTDMPRAEAQRADLLPSDMPRAEPMGSRLLLAAREVTAPVDRGDPVAVLDAGVPDPQASAQALVQDLVSEGIGRGKVERGLVHPYFSQLGKALMKAWDADRSVKEHGLQGYFDMGMERGRAYSRIWLERAEHYGDSGSFGAKDAPEADRRRPASTVGDPTLQARRELRQKMREEFRATRRATIRVVQDAQGQLLDVKLVSPSHQPEVDQEAIKDVRAAAEKLPPPPAEAVGNRERITSLWQFELIISISPPIPSFTFEFDEALGFIDTRMPLDRRIYKRVRLLEVR
jgi:TonB family protein